MKAWVSAVACMALCLACQETASGALAAADGGGGDAAPHATRDAAPPSGQPNQDASKPDSAREQTQDADTRDAARPRLDADASPDSDAGSDQDAGSGRHTTQPEPCAEGLQLRGAFRCIESGSDCTTAFRDHADTYAISHGFRCARDDE